MGEAEYARQAECVLAARRTEELERCEDEVGTDTATGPLPTDRDVCRHVLDIVEREYAGVEGAKTPTPEELQQFLNAFARRCAPMK